MRQLALLLVAASLLIPTAARAQGTLVISQNKCAVDKQAQIRRMTDSLWIPVAQELVNEGKLAAVGSAYHAWGDEWNVVVWYTAANMQTFFSGFGELVNRINQRYPTLFAQMQSWCTEHKDSIYSQGKVTTPAPAAAPSRP